jgi:hypothetical protein
LSSSAAFSAPSSSSSDDRNLQSAVAAAKAKMGASSAKEPDARDALKSRRAILLEKRARVRAWRARAQTLVVAKKRMALKEEELSQCMRTVEELRQRVIDARANVCDERILVAERRMASEKRAINQAVANSKISFHCERLNQLADPVLHGLSWHHSGTQDRLAKLQREKMVRLFEYIPVRVSDPRAGGSSTIAGLPLVKDSQTGSSDICAAALGESLFSAF